MSSAAVGSLSVAATTAGSSVAGEADASRADLSRAAGTAGPAPPAAPAPTPAGPSNGNANANANDNGANGRVDEESQTTYGSWQEEAPRPVDLSRAVSFAAASKQGRGCPGAQGVGCCKCHESIHFRPTPFYDFLLKDAVQPSQARLPARAGIQLHCQRPFLLSRGQARHSCQPCLTVPCCAMLCPAGSVHSVHLSHLKPHELRTISRLRFTTHDLEVEPTPPRRPAVRLLRWVLGFACCSGPSPPCRPAVRLLRWGAQAGGACCGDGGGSGGVLGFAPCSPVRLLRWGAGACLLLEVVWWSVWQGMGRKGLDLFSGDEGMWIQWGGNVCACPCGRR